MIQTVVQLREENKFTNKLIHAIVKHSELRPYFKNFLQEGTVKWLDNSKLKNKEIHIEAMKLYE